MSDQRSAVPLTPAVLMLTLLCCVRSAFHAAPPLAAFAASRMAMGSGRGVAAFCAEVHDEQAAIAKRSERRARDRIMESSERGGKPKGQTRIVLYVAYGLQTVDGCKLR